MLTNAQKKHRAIELKAVGAVVQKKSCYRKAAAASTVRKTALHRELGLPGKHPQLVEAFQTVFSRKN
jgi:hypothetical protein